MNEPPLPKYANNSLRSRSRLDRNQIRNQIRDQDESGRYHDSQDKLTSTRPKQYRERRKLQMAEAQRLLECHNSDELPSSISTTNGFNENPISRTPFKDKGNSRCHPSSLELHNSDDNEGTKSNSGDLCTRLPSVGNIPNLDYQRNGSQTSVVDRKRECKPHESTLSGSSVALGRGRGRGRRRHDPSDNNRLPIKAINVAKEDRSRKSETLPLCERQQKEHGNTFVKSKTVSSNIYSSKDNHINVESSQASNYDGFDHKSIERSHNGQIRNSEKQTRSHLITPENGKLYQLKQRMNIRRQRRRQRLGLIMNSPLDIQDEAEYKQCQNRNRSLTELEIPSNEISLTCRDRSSRKIVEMEDLKSLKELKPQPTLVTSILDNEKPGNEVSKQSPIKYDDSKDEDIMIVHGDKENNQNGEITAESSISSKIGDDDDGSYVEIQRMHCNSCNKSFAPPTFKKLCNTLDENGNPKCASMYKTKRKAFNAAKKRINNNEHLNGEEKQIVTACRRKVVSDMKKKSKGGGKGVIKQKNLKWRQQSEDFRQSMEVNRLISKAEREGKPSHFYLK